MTSQSNNDRFDAFTIEEFEVDGEKRSAWHKIGAAWPHKDGVGYRIVLRAVPLDGVITLRKAEGKPA